MPRRGRSYINQSISFPPEMLAASRERARLLGLSFSAYVQKCLERDLAERGAIIFTESEGNYTLAAEGPQTSQHPARPRKPRVRPPIP